MNIVKKPEIRYPKWLPYEIGSIFNNYIDESYNSCFPEPKNNSKSERKPFVKSKTKFKKPILNDAASKPKDAAYLKKFPEDRLRSILVSPSDQWNRYKENIDFVKNVFLADKVQEVWTDLYKKSKKVSILFARLLINLNSEFEYETNLFANSDKDFKKAKTIYSELLKFSKKFRPYREFEFDYLLGENYHKFLYHLDNFLQNPSSVLKKYEDFIRETELVELENITVKRKNKSDASKEIFYMRKIDNFFKYQLGSANLKKTASIVNVIFKTGYGYEDISNFCRK